MIAMKLANDDHWEEWKKNNTDPYGSFIIRYAERWADMMEQKMCDGAALSDIAKQTSHDADTEGITGFMYGCAVNILADSWAYGEELRKWHNAQYGYHGDGVVNPAIFTIGAKK